MVVYLLADVKRHWFMSAEVSLWGFKFVNLKYNRYLARELRPVAQNLRITVASV